VPATVRPTDLVGADDLTQQEDRDEEPDDQGKKHKNRSFAATDDGESCGYSCKYSYEYRRQAHTCQRHRQPQVIEDSLSSNLLTSAGETHAHHEERRERDRQAYRPPAEPGRGPQMESRPVRVCGFVFHATTIRSSPSYRQDLTGGLVLVEGALTFL